jgi:FtsP/CotA-like multicopper oxidase with cupredoxin domain
MATALLAISASGCSSSGSADGEVVLVAGQPSEGYRDRTVDDSVGFGFDGDQPTTPGPTIRVKAGEPVTITLRNEHYRNDAPFSEPHNFVVVTDAADFIPEPLWDSDTGEIMTDEEATVTFVPDAPGEYSYMCTVGGHRTAGMFGEFIVEE